MKFNNNNNKVISKLCKGIVKKNKTRNIFCIIAIVLTTFLISSVFTIGINFYNNYSVMQKRITGTIASVFLSNPTDNQIQILEDLDVCDSIGKQINVGNVIPSDDNNSSQISLMYYDDICFNKHIMPCISNVKGSYPKSIKEIMLSEDAIKILSLDCIDIGDSFTIRYTINNKEYEDTFTLSGTYKNYPLIQGNGVALVSSEFLDYYNITLEKQGILSMLPKKEYSYTIEDQIKNSSLFLSKDQSIEYGYSVVDDIKESAYISTIMALIVSLFIILSGYLLIYNIVYISVIKDINFYGLLKTIGTSPKQIRKIVIKQANLFSIIGIPIGLILAAIASLGIVPMFLEVMGNGTGNDFMPSSVSFNPIIFILAAFFSYFTVRISCRKSAKIAGNISPVEALRYTVSSNKKCKNTRASKNCGKIYKMSWNNIFRDKKRTFLVFTSLFMGMITFISVTTFLSCISVDNFINANVKNDFSIKTYDENSSGYTSLSSNEKTSKIEQDTIDKINNLKGIKEVNISKSTFVNFDYKIFDKYIDDYYILYNRSEEEKDILKSNYENNNGNAEGFINSTDDSIIEKLNKKYDLNISETDFKNGSIAVVEIPSNFKECYNKVKDYLDGKEITFNSVDFSSKDNSNKNYPKTIKNSFTIKLKTVLDDCDILPRPKAYNIIPNIFISNSISVSNDFEDYMIDINVEEDYEKEISSELKEICNNNYYDLEIKSDQKAFFSNMEVVIGILGGGISFILILIGIINFINVMITGINVRLSEFAVLESIGMTKKQQYKMVTIEGLYYALISNIFLYTLGSAIMYIFVKLTKKIVPFADFNYPVVQMAILSLTILIICVITPSITLKVSSKNSITERLRRNE